MSYTPVPIVTTGDLWTASNHNTYIRDNFNQVTPYIVQAAGDLTYASASNSITRMPIVSRSVLAMGETVPEWLHGTLWFEYLRSALSGKLEFGDGYIGELVYANPNSYATTAYPVTETPISFNNVLINKYSMWSSGDPTKIYIPSTWPANRWYIVNGYFHSPGVYARNNLIQGKFLKNALTYFGGQSNNHLWLGSGIELARLCR